VISASREIPPSVYETGWFDTMFTRPCVTLGNHQPGIPPLSAVRAFLFITLQVPDTAGTCVLPSAPESLKGDIQLMLIFFFPCLFAALISSSSHCT